MVLNEHRNPEVTERITTSGSSNDASSLSVSMESV